jgi:hypothetical protein
MADVLARVGEGERAQPVADVDPPLGREVGLEQLLELLEALELMGGGAGLGGVGDVAEFVDDRDEPVALRATLLETSEVLPGAGGPCLVRGGRRVALGRLLRESEGEEGDVEEEGHRDTSRIARSVRSAGGPGNVAVPFSATAS